MPRRDLGAAFLCSCPSIWRQKAVSAAASANESERCQRTQVIEGRALRPYVHLQVLADCTIIVVRRNDA